MALPFSGRLRRELAWALLLKLLALWLIARTLPPRHTADEAAAGLAARLMHPPATAASAPGRGPLTVENP